MTVGGSAIPDTPDLARMRRDRHAKLQAEMAAAGLDGLVLVTTSAASFATGAAVPGCDSARAALLRAVAVVVRGAPAPHLFTPYPEGVPAELQPAFVHPALFPELPDGIEEMTAVLRGLFPTGARIGVDDLPHPLAAAASGFELVGAAPLLGAAKLCKTPDELACIRTAQRINESAMVSVQHGLRPGLRQTDLTARFLGQVFELGATSNAIDPIWQAMPPTRAAGTWTTHGDIAFPTPTTDRILLEGDTVWVDTGILYRGYASDFGRTWLVADEPRPTSRQQGQFERWRAVVDAVLEWCRPGVSALELDRAAIAANGGVKPWLEHFYLAHGVGTDSAEMPLIGTDLGEAFDEQLVLRPGMVLVLEPVIWDDGAAGYRSEDIVAITDDGWEPLSDHPYDPYGTE
jgi:Xaa-Pro aminopeptidase